MSLPSVIVTGASGFVGRHVVEQLREEYRIFCIARRSQRRAGVAEHANVSWHEADIAERGQLEPVFRTIAEAMRPVWASDYLKIYWLLQKHEADILEAFHAALTGPDRRDRFPSYQRLAAAEHDWNHRLLVSQLFSAVRTGDKSVFTTYCHDLAVRRFHEGFSAEEFCGAVELLNLICMRILRRDRASDGMRQQMVDYLTMTLRYGCDQAQETFEELSIRGGTWSDRQASISPPWTSGTSSARSG